MVEKQMAKPEYEEAVIRVFWDIENCPLPREYRAERMVEQLKYVLGKLNYRGPISISAYGNMNHIPPSIKHALSSTGVILHHVYPRKLHNHIFEEILDWRYNGTARVAPANVMVISRDSFSIPFNHMQSQGFNILLVHPPNPCDGMLAYATTTWIWKSLLEES